MGSNACSPPCSGAGVCSASGQCTCPSGFNGTSCEVCAKGFFGPSCQACPAGCTACDDGITGSGRCLSSTTANLSSTCNCLNGVCGANGQCSCNAGWTTASNGTQCATCAPGFFLDGNGNCAVCGLGCQQCADGSGICVACKQGFTQDANDRTKCDAVQSVTTSGTVCPDGSFSSGSACQPCSPSCSTCSGSTSNDCIVCGNGQFSLGGSCVPTNGNGICTGSSMIANNNKHACDSKLFLRFLLSKVRSNWQYRLPSEMYFLWDSQLQRSVNYQPITVCDMSSWFRVVEWLVRWKLSIWNLSFSNEQFDVHSYVFISVYFLHLF